MAGLGGHVMSESGEPSADSGVGTASGGHLAARALRAGR